MQLQEFKKQIEFFDNSKLLFIRNLIYNRCISFLNNANIKHSVILNGFAIQIDDNKEIIISYLNASWDYFIIEYYNITMKIDIFIYDNLFDENSFISKINKMIKIHKLLEKIN